MSRIYVSFFTLIACAFPLYAQPKGGNITHGNAQITQHSNETHITTKTDKTVIGWKDFSVNKGEMVKFHQPSALSAVLNRVLGQNPSAILGSIQSNGQVYLLNPNGILFGENATVNVSSLIASTLDIHDQAFINGNALEFMGDSQGSIKNLGTIKTSDGDALLIGRFVENSGTLEAHEGQASTLACTYFLYHPNSDKPFYIKADSPSDLNTDGNAFSHAISTDADPDAFTITRENGEVYLTSVKNSGTIRSKKGENGGTINILGDRVELEETSIIDVSGKNHGGNVQVGGSFQGKDPNVLTSQLTFVKKGSHIDASAFEEGDGGRVIIWSDKETNYYGHVDAKAGRQSGDGGFIEISVPTHLLTFRGTVDASSLNGKAGRLLLDPNDIIIQSPTATSGGFANPYMGTGFQPARLLDTDLTTPLGAGTDVTVQTSVGTAGGSGDITVDPTATLSWAGAPTPGGLTLNAFRDVNLQADIRITAGTGGTGVNIIAGRDFNSAIASEVALASAGTPISVTAARNINAQASLINTDNSGAAANVTVIAQTGNITMTADDTSSVIFGSQNGAVYVEATQGSITMTGGPGPASNRCALIGYYDPNLGSTDPFSGPVTVLAGQDMILQAGVGPLAHAMICKQGRGRHDSTNSPVTATVGRDLFISSGNGTDAPGAGIGRPQQLVVGPVNHSGDIVVNVGRDCTVFGGDNFSGIGDRALTTGGGSIATNLSVNVGRNLMVGHNPTIPSTTGISGGFIGVFDNQFGIIGVNESVHGFVHINVGNNFIMDGRLGSAFVEFQNDNADLANFPAELFVHVGNSLILLGGPTYPLTPGATISAAFNIIETINSNNHFWALNSIQCVNGATGAANLHNKAFNATNVVSANLGTISVRAGGDIRVAGGAAARTGDILVDYEATGGFTYVADSPFQWGELWAPQIALVGGVNVFAGTPLAAASPPVFSNGQGAISFDTNLYNTTAIPLSTAQLAQSGYNSFTLGAPVAIGNPITYWSQNGSDTLMSTQPVFATGAPADILNIGTTGSSISFNNETRAPIYTAPTNPFTGDGGDITIIAFRDTVISGPSTVNPPPPPPNSVIPIFAPSGNILVITQNDMTLQNNAIVSAGINVDLVCDNQAPVSPQIGPGSFSMDATSIINSDTGYIRVYTARQAQNVIDPLAQFISAGVPYFFIPGQLFVDTDQEKWCTYYPDGDQGVPFKIFYKPCLALIAQEAMLILTEFLYKESSFNYYLGWPENYYVYYKPKHPLEPGDWRSTFNSFNVLPTERYYIRRQDDTQANNNPRTYLTW